MLKELNEFNMEYNFNLVLSSSSYAVYIFCLDKKDYMEYKNGISKEFTEERKIEMNTLQLLENLGYPMDELGTYLYKNIIVKVIKSISVDEGFINCKNLLLQLKDAFSQFYFDIARNDLDMGLKTFHRHIEDTLSKVDYSKANPLIINKIYSKNIYDIDYGEQAFILGACISGLLKTEQSLEIVKPKIKKLSNMLDNY